MQQNHEGGRAGDLALQCEGSAHSPMGARRGQLPHHREARSADQRRTHAAAASLASAAAGELAGGAHARPAAQIKPTIANALSLNAWADNWCVIFINGKMVAMDSIDFLPHNKVSVKILPE